MNAFFGDGTGAPPPGPGATAPPADPPAAPPAADPPPPAGPAVDLTGKPEWLPDAFWKAPKETGGAAPWEEIAQAVAKSQVEGRKKITEQGEMLAKFTVPDTTDPYFQGIDRETLLKTHERSGWTPEMLEQAAAQARSAGMGPGVFQGFVQAHLKAQHEATAAPKDAEALRGEAVAALNAQGRPGSQMLADVQRVGSAFVSEGRWTPEVGAAVAKLAESPEGLTALHGLLMESGPAAPPNGRTSLSHGNAQIVADIRARMADHRYPSDRAFTEKLKADMRRHASLLEASMDA